MNNYSMISSIDPVSVLPEDITGFKILSLIESKNEVCPFCGCKHTALSMHELIAVGFGNALLTKDGESIYSEMEVKSCNDYMSVAEAEVLAAKNPNHDWRIHLISPFSEMHYQRQGECHWVLYEKGEGFA